MIIELLKKQMPLKRLQRYENYAIAERFSTNQIRKKMPQKKPAPVPSDMVPVSVPVHEENEHPYEIGCLGFPLYCPWYFRNLSWMTPKKASLNIFLLILEVPSLRSVNTIETSLI